MTRQQLQFNVEEEHPSRREQEGPEVGAGLKGPKEREGRPAQLTHTV